MMPAITTAMPVAERRLRNGAPAANNMPSATPAMTIVVPRLGCRSSNTATTTVSSNTGRSTARKSSEAR